MHGLKSAILAIFLKSADWLKWPCPVSAALHFRSQEMEMINCLWFLGVPRMPGTLNYQCLLI